MNEQVEATIGLEAHARLLTKTKIFCACPSRYGDRPNTNVCPVCLGLPGALPSLNAEAVRQAVLAALALGCRVNERSVFVRKNYFYPDLPKGYQITQYDEPLAVGGIIPAATPSGRKEVRIKRLHLEEDAGKSIHDDASGNFLVDFNRCGTALVEIVSEPDMRSPGEAVACFKALRGLLMAVGVCDGNMQEGSLRCDANVSVRGKRSSTKSRGRPR
jgi:aspartyl-tRNA(Asn)/glutamyl-tRNA(Gln) amidotransferase subunit B